jgi:hypothetical protein
MSTELQIISKALLEDLKKNVPNHLSETFEAFHSLPENHSYLKLVRLKQLLN